MSHPPSRGARAALPVRASPLLALATLALLAAPPVFAQADTSALDPRLGTYAYPYPVAGRTETLVGDAARVGWADTFSVYGGWLYYTDSPLDEVQVGQAVGG